VPNFHGDLMPFLGASSGPLLWMARPSASSAKRSGYSEGEDKSGGKAEVKTEVGVIDPCTSRFSKRCNLEYGCHPEDQMQNGSTEPVQQVILAQKTNPLGGRNPCTVSSTAVHNESSAGD
jgi:hypothetical protein